MGLLDARPYGAAANGKGVSKPAIFTIVAEILRRQREENESAAADDPDDGAGAETDKERSQKKADTRR
jgi:hypothetical protein